MSIFIIPMAGLSSRFFKAGYTKPKYQLDIQGQSMFSWSVLSFENYFKTDTFIFVCRNVYQTPIFIADEIKKLGIEDYKVICLDYETRGQAETVFLGLSNYFKDMQSPNIFENDLYIFNIDSKIIDFKKPNFVTTCDGYLEVFKEEGNHWSFVEPGENGTVLRTTEKDRISDLCSDGLYYFSTVNKYMDLFNKTLQENKFVKNELYIAPMYNDLISRGLTVKYELVDREKVIICGTPSEYIQMIEGK
ncbi:MAG: glycosyltransferase family 2 protein [Succinivibrionaceae bacterium]